MALEELLNSSKALACHLSNREKTTSFLRLLMRDIGIAVSTETVPALQWVFSVMVSSTPTLSLSQTVLPLFQHFFVKQRPQRKEWVTRKLWLNHYPEVR